MSVSSIASTHDEEDLEDVSPPCILHVGKETRAECHLGPLFSDMYPVVWRCVTGYFQSIRCLGHMVAWWCYNEGLVKVHPDHSTVELFTNANRFGYGN